MYKYKTKSIYMYTYTHTHTHTHAHTYTYTYIHIYIYNKTSLKYILDLVRKVYKAWTISRNPCFNSCLECR